MLDYDYLRIFYFYRGPQKATLYGPTRIQPQIQFRLVDHAITMVNLQNIYIYFSKATKKTYNLQT
jgi:hypothetical protein